MGFAIDGLVSGLDTTTMISQLMQLEARPQTMLKEKVSSTQSLVTALQQLNTRVASLGGVAEKAAAAGALDLYKATSSSDKATATAGIGGAGGSGTGQCGPTEAGGAGVVTNGVAGTGGAADGSLSPAGYWSAFGGTSGGTGDNGG